MFRNIVLIGAFLLSFITVNAQSLSIKGVLQDRSDKVPLAGATLRLSLQSDSLIRFNAVSDKQGAFEFRDLSPQTYILTISSVGYETQQQTIILTDSSKDLGIVQVSRQAKLLSEVTVKVSTPPVRQKTDTLEYSANAFKVNPDANAEDMMKKMPGVTVDKGTVTAQGEQVRKVTIDGRDFFGDDATAALRNLPAEVIDKIQVFDRLSDQAQFTGFDDGNAVKAINIVTKADMRNGQFGRIYAGYGTDERYSAGGNMTFFNGTRRISVVGQINNINQQNFASQDLLGVTSNVNRGGGGGGNRGGGGNNRGGGGNPGGGGGNWGGGGQGNFLVGQQPGISKTNAFGVNFSDQWGKNLQVTGSYFYNKNTNLNNERINREYFASSEDSAQFYQENSLTNSDNYNHRVNMRMEYKIDSSNSIIFTPRLRMQKNNSFSSLNSELSYPNAPVSVFSSSDRAFGNGYNFSGELLYRHAFAKRGRTISINLESEWERNSGETYIESINRFYKGSIPQEDSLQQFSDRVNKGREFTVNVNYTEPLGKGQLQFNYRPSWTVNNADQQTFHYDAAAGKYSVFDDSLSNKLDNTYNTQNGGISYRVGDRDNSFSIGLNYQHAVLEGQQTFPYVAKVERSFSNLLPNLRWQKKISPRSSIRVFYRARTNPPSVTQLQDVINIRNILFPSTGNPELNQDYAHSLVTRYQFTNSAKRTSFFANIFVQNTQNYITNASYLITKDSAVSSSIVLREGARLTKPVNLDGYWSVRSFLTFGMPLNFIKSSLNLNAGVSYSRIPGLIDNVENLSNSYNYNVGAVVASNINEYVDFTLSYSANFNRVQNSIQPQLNNNYFNHVAGMQLNLLSKKGWLFQNDVTNQMFRGLTTGFNQNYWLWNMAVGKKFLKDQKGELKLSVFDLLKQNQAISREVNEIFIEDVQNDVLQQYFMLTFTYKLRNFGGRSRNNAK
ncbi:MAG TPA: outer membrane beta-barrel protein [Chitinophagaceae bacterium]|nr:outer membrane beta-barrel protein [Chitinophagaceae bacterium]